MEQAPGVKLVGSQEGVWAEAQPHGGLKWLNWRTTKLNMYAANPLEIPLANLWLRSRAGTEVTAVHPLLGPTSHSTVSVTDGELVVTGSFAGLGYRAHLVLGEEEFAWVVGVTADEAGEFDLVAVGRSLISDAEWVRKVRTGRFDKIRPFTRADLRRSNDYAA